MGNPVYNTTVIEADMISKSAQFGIGIYLCIAMCIGVSGNTMTVLIISLNKKLQSIPNVYIFNLAIADTLLLSVNLPTTINEFFKTSKSYDFSYCNYTSVINITTMLAALHSAGAVALNRYIFICKPAAVYKRYSSKIWIAVTVGIIWGWSFLLASPPILFGFGTYGYHSKFHTCFFIAYDTESYWFGALFCCLIGVFPVVISSTFFYHQMFKKIRRTITYLEDTGNNSDPADSYEGTSLTYQTQGISPICSTCDYLDNSDIDIMSVVSATSIEVPDNVGMKTKSCSKMDTATRSILKAASSPYRFRPDLLNYHMAVLTHKVKMNMGLGRDELPMLKMTAKQLQAYGGRNSLKFKRDSLRIPSQLKEEEEEEHSSDKTDKGKHPSTNLSVGSALFTKQNKILPHNTVSKSPSFGKTASAVLSIDLIEKTSSSVNSIVKSKQRIRKKKSKLRQQNINNSSVERLKMSGEQSVDKESKCSNFRKKVTPTKVATQMTMEALSCWLDNLPGSTENKVSDFQSKKSSPADSTSESSSARELVKTSQQISLKDLDYCQSSLPAWTVAHGNTCNSAVEKFIKPSPDDPNFNVKVAKKLRRQFKLENMQKQIRVIRMLLVIFLIIVTCWIPIALNFVLDPYGLVDSIYYVLFTVLAWTNSCVNVFIYAGFNPQFRSAYWSLLQGRKSLTTLTISSKQQLSSEMSKIIMEYYQRKRDLEYHQNA